MIKIKVTHDQLGILLCYLNDIINQNQEMKNNLSTNSFDFHLLDAETEILCELKRKLHKRYIDERKQYSINLLKMQALLIGKNLQHIPGKNAYLENEMSSISADLHFHLLND